MLVKEFHTLFLLLSLSLSLLFLLPGACAVNVPDSQQDIALTLERGSSFEFPLLVMDIEETSTLKSSGDIADWVFFGEDETDEYEIHAPSYLTPVKVTINIPDNAKLGEYEGDINSGSTILSDLRIKVTLELSDAKAYEKLSDVDEEVGHLNKEIKALRKSMDDMEDQIETLQNQINSKMEEIMQYQKNLDELEKENQDLKSENTGLKADVSSLTEKSQNLEESNKELNDLTGALVGTQLPGMFFVGIILGIIAVTLLVRREHVIKKVKSKLKGLKKERGKEDQFRYQFKG